MSHVEQEVAQRKDACNHRWDVSADGTGHPSRLLNVLWGVVTSRREGLTRTTLRIRIGERTDLRVRRLGTFPTTNTIEVEQTVRITIPADAVQLEAGWFRRGKQRWNRWIGRVVLVNQTNHDLITTAKIHRDSIALHSVGPVIGAACLTIWDTVNIVVDPHQVGVTPIGRPCRRVRPSLSSSLPVAPQPSLVWLRGTIRSVRAIPKGLFVALSVGGVRISTIIEPNLFTMLSWIVGSPVAISISPYDAWIRRCAESPTALCSTVFVERDRHSSVRRSCSTN